MFVQLTCEIEQLAAMLSLWRSTCKWLVLWKSPTFILLWSDHLIFTSERHSAKRVNGWYLAFFLPTFCEYLQIWPYSCNTKLLGMKSDHLSHFWGHFNSSFYIGDNSALSQNDAYSELTKLLFLHSPTISDGCCSVVKAYATCIIVITVLISS